MARPFDATDVAMAGLVLVWGTAFVSLRVLGDVLDPFALTWFRYVPFLAFFAVWLPWARGDRFRRVSGGDWLRFTACGFLGVAGYHLPINWATTSVTPGEPVTGGMAAVIVATTPLWTILWVRLAGGERMTRRQVGGSALAFAGVAVVVFLGHPAAEGPTFHAKAWIALLAPLLWSLYSVIAKPLVHRHGGLFTTGVAMGLGTLVFVPYGLRLGVDPLRGLDGVGWAWLVYLSVLSTLGGYIVWNLALKHRSPGQITAYIYAVPVIATLAGVLLIDERVTLYFALGTALVLYGLVQVQKRSANA